MSAAIKVPTVYDMTNLTYADSSAAAFWIEEIANQSPRNNEFGTKYANASLVGYVNGYENKYYDFINTVLGYSSIQTGETQLARNNPMQHPKFPNLYASRITSSQGIKYEHRVIGLNVGATPGQLRQYAHYNRELVVIEFAPVRYNIREDAAISGAEYNRNVQYDVAPKLYDVSMIQGQFKFAEGDDDNPKAKSFPGELNFIEVKTTFNLKWINVPEDFIFDNVTYPVFGYPTKIAGAGGKVNDAEFCGYPAGTLLLLEPEIDRYVSGTLQSTDNGKSPIFRCDVVLPIIHFDPPNLGTYKGHNLKPWWKTGAISTVGYYLVTADGGVTGTRIYGATDFAKIFKKWNS